MNFIVVAYYTNDQYYTAHSRKLMQSLAKFKLPSEVRRIESLGGFQKNTHYKPHFILEMLDKYKDQAIVYTDVDSEFLQYPELFHELNCDVAAYLLDHSQFRRKTVKPELLSGTIYFGNTTRSRELIQRWIQICEENPTVWDQATLQQALLDEYTLLPPQYCCIYDYMRDVSGPVIMHYQASRETRRREAVANSLKRPM